MLADKQKAPLSFSHEDVFTEIELPARQPDPYVSVVVLEYNQKPSVTDKLVAKTTEDGFMLTPANRLNEDTKLNTASKTRGGTIPSHALVAGNQKLLWKIYIDEPGEKQADLSYSFQGKKNSNNRIILKAAGDALSHKVIPTGKTVGEPNSDWVIDNYKSITTGKIMFPEKGIYEIEMHVEAGRKEEIKFQWIWIK